MGTSALKSTTVTNADSTTYTLNKKGLVGGVLKSSIGTVETVSADDTSSTYRLVRVKSNVYIRRIHVYNDAMAGSSAIHVGVYQTAANGGAVVDVDVFATGVSLVSASSAGTTVAFEAGTSTAGVEDIETQLWQMLGLSSDPQREYDIVATPSATIDTGGSLSLEVVFVDGD